MKKDKKLEKKLWKIIGEVRTIQQVYNDDRQVCRAEAITRQINKAVASIEDILDEIASLEGWGI